MTRLVVDLEKGIVHIVLERQLFTKRNWVHVVLRNSYFRCARGWAVDNNPNSLAAADRYPVLSLQSLWEMMTGGAFEVWINHKLMNKDMSVYVRRPMAVVRGPNDSPLDDAFLCKAVDPATVMGEIMQFIDPRITVAMLSSKSRGVRSRWIPATSLADRAIVTAHIVAYFAGEAREKDFQMSPSDL